jgi:hypothetical protein
MSICNFLYLRWGKFFLQHPALLPARFYAALNPRGLSHRVPNLTQGFGDLLSWTRHSVWGCVSDEQAVQGQGFYPECSTVPEKDPPTSQYYSIQSLRDLQMCRSKSLPPAENSLILLSSTWVKGDYE